jgi:hypothetical protein
LPLDPDPGSGFPIRIRIHKVTESGSITFLCLFHTGTGTGILEDKRYLQAGAGYPAKFVSGASLVRLGIGHPVPVIVTVAISLNVGLWRVVECGSRHLAQSGSPTVL